MTLLRLSESKVSVALELSSALQFLADFSFRKTRHHYPFRRIIAGKAHTLCHHRQRLDLYDSQVVRASKVQGLQPVPHRN